MTRMTKNRREVLKGFGAAAVLLAAPPSLGNDPMGVGVLYGGSRTDFGYNQAHADAARAVAALPGVRLEEREETAGNLAALAEELAGPSGCRVVFVTSPGDALPGLLAQADANRDTAFLLCGAPMDESRLPVNVGFFEGFLDEAQHVCGIVAGYSSRTRHIGFVASRPVPSVLRSVNAFALGTRRADPAIAVRVAFVGDHAPAAAVAAAARALVEGGVDVLAAHVGQPLPVCEVAESSGVLCCGVHTDLSATAPQGFLTGAEWDWSRAYIDTVAKLAEGKPWPRKRQGGFGAGLVRNTAYGPAVPVDARAHADAARMQLANGNAAVFRGPIHDNTGRLVVAKGKALASQDPALDRMIWLAEGVSEAGR